MVSLKDNVMSNNYEQHMMLMVVFLAQNAERYVSEFADQFPEDLKIGDLYFVWHSGFWRIPGNRLEIGKIRNVFSVDYRSIVIWSYGTWIPFDVLKQIRLTDTI